MAQIKSKSEEAAAKLDFEKQKQAGQAQLDSQQQMIDAKLALKQLPPLIKGYLRIGARFGTGAVIDRQFGTTDVLVVLPVAAIDKRYADYYGGEGPRHAA